MTANRIDITDALRGMCDGETRVFGKVAVARAGQDEFRVNAGLPTSFPNTVRLLRSMGVEYAETGEPLEWAALWGEMRTNYNAGRVAWAETTEAMYDAMLGAVPPARHVSGGFLCGEPWDHNDAGEPVYAAFTRRAGRVEACYLTLRQFRDLVG